MMNKSKIDWCDFSWNPVTGCRHGCSYCYARKQARRFCGDVRLNLGSSQIYYVGDDRFNSNVGGYVLPRPFKSEAGTTLSFPAGFEPTFHEYRLPMPAQRKKPANIFVCSMADLFGEWVPEDWIVRVFDACKAAPQHNYLFLTKNPGRYADLKRSGILPDGDNFWYGATWDHSNWSIHKGGHDAGDYYFPDIDDENIHRHTFVSFEPLLQGFNIGSIGAEWVIVGAETGNRHGKVKPERKWIEDIVTTARKENAAVLLKDSAELREVWGDDLIQEFPVSLQHEEIPVPHCSECEHLKTTERHYDPFKDVTAMNHFCTAKTLVRRIEGRYVRTSPSWCPKRKGNNEK